MSSKTFSRPHFSSAIALIICGAGALTTLTAQADIIDWDKITANVAGGVYKGTSAAEYSSAGAGFGGDLGLGYRVGEHSAIGMQWRYDRDIASHLGQTFEQSFWCRNSHTCKADAIHTNSFNLMFQQRPLSLLSYGVGLGWMKEDNSLEAGSLVDNQWQGRTSYLLDVYRVTMPYEVLLNFPLTAGSSDSHSWMIQAGIKGEICSRICTYGLYVGTQFGL